MRTSTRYVAGTFILMAIFTCLQTEAQRRNYPGRYDRGAYARGNYYHPRNYNRSNFYFRPSIPRGHISLSFGGNPFYYHGGNFYRPFGNSISIVIPPVGIRIGSLPYGYRRLYVGPELYYFYNGIYYRQQNDRQYAVVNAPIGAQLSSLPSGSKVMVINGEKFYELNGTFYKEEVGSNGSLAYTVVGKHGETDNTVDEDQSIVQVQIGDLVNILPQNCKTVVINGQKLFVSPDEFYYSEEINGKEINYRVVGKGNSGLPE